MTFVNNAWLHPIRAAKLVFRRWLIHRDANAAALETEPPVPLALRQFTIGELLPCKGYWFRVAKITGDPIPAIILVPHALTTGSKLRALRNVRDAGREHLSEQRRISKALRKEVH